MLQSQNNSVIVQNILLTFCKNRPFNETKNSKLGEMHGGGGGGANSCFSFSNPLSCIGENFTRFEISKVVSRPSLIIFDCSTIS